MQSIRVVAAEINPARTLAVSADDANDRFLECAETAGADCIVTGKQTPLP